MSIWTDMIKYNIKKKKMYVDDIPTNTIYLDFTNNALDTSYKTIGEFVPMVSGSVKLIFDFEKTWGNTPPSRRDDTVIQIFNETDNIVVHESMDTSSSAVHVIEIKAGKKYSIKSKISVASGDNIIRNEYFYPVKVNFLYSIKEVSEHILTKVVNE